VIAAGSGLGSGRPVVSEANRIVCVVAVAVTGIATFGWVHVVAVQVAELMMQSTLGATAAPYLPVSGSPW